MINFTILGLAKWKQVGVNVGQMKTRIYDTLAAQMVLMAQAVKYTAKDKYLSGRPGLNAPSGRLRSSIHTTVKGDGTSVQMSIGSNVVYARIHEYGGTTRPHIIFAPKGKTLAFMGRSGMSFRKFVRHPGSKIPARPYLAPSIADNITPFSDRLGTAIAAVGREAFR